MNILITINDRYVDYLLVMLTSLFKNNEADISIYCLYHELMEEKQKVLKDFVERYQSSINFIYVDEFIYKEFPTTEALTVECYFILMAHELLPSDIERILYLDSDLIVNGRLDEFYNTSFDDYYMVVCGNVHKLIEGKSYQIGARPEKGQCFNSGVLLMDLCKFRKNITISTYLNAAKAVDFKFELADQGILNILFWDKVKYENTLKYNFRISIYRKYIQEEMRELQYEPVIYHYVMHDYYRIGWGYKPWDLLLNKKEFQDLSDLGIARRQYGDELVVEMNDKMQNLWWGYAKQTEEFQQMWKRMEEKKEQLLNKLYVDYQKNAQYYSQKQSILNKISGSEKCSINELQNYRYFELASYIDTLSSENAIQTMKNLFEINLCRLKKQKSVKVAFVVYSSSEWQCEDLYRKMEGDKRFLPAVYICSYAHGDNEQTLHTYRDTCRFFLKSKKKYHLEFGGFQTKMPYREKIDDYDIIFYFNSWECLCPHQNNIGQRRLSQLLIHIPYGIYLSNKRDAYYYDDYYNRILFQCSWIYFAESILHKAEAKEMQRLQAYNIIVSGFPKCDALLEHKIDVQSDLWKDTLSKTTRIIWAPHFNMQVGMNGTFYENYEWFYQYAKEHQEISWIVRPHPRMETGVLETGVFQTLDEYEAYLAQWEKLPNARVAKFGSYIDIFADSDAMILDSLSFVTEYQYTGKPLLFLEPELPRSIGKYGKQLFSHLYTSRGNDFKKISEFIDMIAKKRDPMKNERKKFFDTYLDYKKLNGTSATQFILDTVKRGVEGVI